MARYGFEYDAPYYGWGGARYPERGFGYGPGFGRYDAGFRGGFAGRRDAGDDFPDGYWSATEYGVYLGADQAAPRGYDAGYRGGYGTPGMQYGMDDAGWGRGMAGGSRWREPRGADDVRVGDIMTENPEAVTPDTPLAEVARLMRDLDVGIIPVVDDPERGHLKGVITDRDIAVRAAAEGKDMAKTPVSDAMTGHVETVMQNHHVQDVFDVMKRERVRRVPVTDEDGRLIGIVAQADLAIDYAGLDLDREAEVEEVIERISEPGRPGRMRAKRNHGQTPRIHRQREYDQDFGDRMRERWQALRREARGIFHRGYDRDWR